MISKALVQRISELRGNVQREIEIYTNAINALSLVAKPHGREQELMSDYKNELGNLFKRSASLYSLERYAKSQPLVVSMPADSDAEMAIHSSNENADFGSDLVIAALMGDPVYRGKILNRTLTEKEYRNAEDKYKQSRYGFFRAATSGQEAPQETNKHMQPVAEPPKVEAPAILEEVEKQSIEILPPKTNAVPREKRHKEPHLVSAFEPKYRTVCQSRQMLLRQENPLIDGMTLATMINEGLTRPEDVAAYDLRCSKVYPPSVKMRDPYNDM